MSRIRTIRDNVCGCILKAPYQARITQASPYDKAFVAFVKVPTRNNRKRPAERWVLGPAARPRDADARRGRAASVGRDAKRKGGRKGNASERPTTDLMQDHPSPPACRSHHRRAADEATEEPYPFLRRPDSPLPFLWETRKGLRG